MGQHAHMYRGRWHKLRARHLGKEPLCRMCSTAGAVTPAEVVDHIAPHRGDAALFYDPANLQSLCKRHHDSDKQREERSGYGVEMVDADGYKLDGSW